MNSKFDQELLQDYMEKIILKSKERAMLIASERGLIEQVAKMINDAIYPLKNKGLKVRSGSDDVRYWLTTSEAKVSAYSLEDIEVVLGFACSPAEIMGKVKLTTGRSPDFGSEAVGLNLLVKRLPQRCDRRLIAARIAG